MNTQEAFDTMVKHLFTQRKPSRRMDGVCTYRTESGLKCAVGALIPDDKYTQRMEEKGAMELVNDFPELFPDITTEQIQFLYEAQGIHDTDPEILWKSSLHSLAQAYSLDTTILDQQEPITEEELDQ